MSIVLSKGGPVNFPELGLAFEHLIEGFDLFGIHISLMGILTAVAMLLALYITECLAKKTQQNKEHYLDLAIRVVFAGIIGARTGYVFSHWEYFITDQGNVFDIRDGGMSASGALIGGLLVAFIYCRQKKLSWLQFCDTALPGITLGQILASIGCFFGRNMLGTYTEGPFAMQVAMQDVDAKAVMLSRSAGPMMKGNFLQVHPVALYEAVILLLLLIVLQISKKIKKVKGMVLALYLIGYGLMIFSMEFIRLDSQKIMGTRFSIEHIVAAVLVLAGILILTEQLKKDYAIRKAQPKNLSVPKKSK